MVDLDQADHLRWTHVVCVAGLSTLAAMTSWEARGEASSKARGEARGGRLDRGGGKGKQTGASSVAGSVETGAGHTTPSAGDVEGRALSHIGVKPAIGEHSPRNGQEIVYELLTSPW